MFNNDLIINCHNAIYCKNHNKIKQLVEFAVNNGFIIDEPEQIMKSRSCYLSLSKDINTLFKFNRDYFLFLDYQILTFEDVLLDNYKEKFTALCESLEIEQIDKFIDLPVDEIKKIGCVMTEISKNTIKTRDILTGECMDLEEKIEKMDKTAFENLRTVVKLSDEIRELKNSVLGLSSIVTKQKNKLDKYDELPF